MINAVVFETPGLLDVRALTIMGAHAKPNTPNPIGFFGTGLKYAIAVLVRLGAEPIIWIGQDRFTFSKKTSRFRGTDLETIVMRVLKAGNKRATSYELPYTTAYGKRWEVWQAFRELESNTRDERGRTYIVEAEPEFFHEGAVWGESDRTKIVVVHPEFAEVAEKIDEIFLPRARREGTLLEICGEESDRLFYRTMRAYDLSKPSLFTYNFLEQLELTEDRTLKYEFYAKQVLARWVLTEANSDQIEQVLKADKDHWEHNLELPARYRPSAAFEEVMKNRRRGLPKTAWTYYSSYTGPSRRTYEPARWDLFEEHPKPWRVDGTAVVDKNGEEIFTIPDGYSQDEWALTANKVIKLLRADPQLSPPEPPRQGVNDEVPF